MYIVVFEGLDKDQVPPISERTFGKKEDAKAYKHEHEHGKIAAVIPMRGTFGE